MHVFQTRKGVDYKLDVVLPNPGLVSSTFSPRSLRPLFEEQADHLAAKSANSTEKQSVPIAIFFHGGGICFGSRAENEWFPGYLQSRSASPKLFAKPSHCDADSSKWQSNAWTAE